MKIQRQKIKNRQNVNLFSNRKRIDTLMRKVLFLSPVLCLLPKQIKACAAEDLGDEIELSGDVYVEPVPTIEEPSVNTTQIGVAIFTAVTAIFCVFSLSRVAAFKKAAEAQEDTSEVDNGATVWKILSIVSGIIFVLLLMLTLAMIRWPM